MNDTIKTAAQAEALPNGTVVIRNGEAHTKDTKSTTRLGNERMPGFDWLFTESRGGNATFDARANDQMIGATIVYRPPYSVGDTIPFAEARDNLEVGSVIQLEGGPRWATAWKRYHIGWLGTGDNGEMCYRDDDLMEILYLPATKTER